MDRLFQDPAAGAAEFDWSGRRLDELPVFPTDDYRPDPFVVTQEIERIRRLPRYDFPTDFSDAVVNGNSDTREQYLIGLSIGSLVVFFIFLVWSFVLLVLKCCGRKRVGCASGVPNQPLPPMHPPSSSFSTPSVSPTGADGEAGEEGGLVKMTPSVPAVTDQFHSENEQVQYENDLAEYEKKMEKFRRRIRWTRIWFLIAGGGVIVATVLFFVMGIGSFIHSLTHVQNTLDYSEDVLDRSINVTEWYVNSSGDLKGARDQFREDVNQFCPSLDVPLDNEEFNNVRKILTDVVDATADVNENLEKQARSIRQDLIEIRDSVSSVNEGLNKAYPFLYTATAVFGVLIIIVIFLMVSVVLAWNQRKVKNCFVQCMKNAIVIPIFIFFMIMAWLFATLFLLFAVAGSDFCVTPDENVAAVLDKIQESEEGENILIELLKFYVLGCNEANAIKPQEFEEGFTIVSTVGEAVHGFLVFLTSPEATQAIQVICSEGGNDSFSTLNKTASILHGQLHVVLGLVIAVLNILSCRTMSPLYTGVVHDGMCVNGVNGLVWIYTTQVVIAICCMFMITLRAATQEIEEDNDDEVAKNILVPAVAEEEAGGMEKAVDVTVTGDDYEKSYLS